MTDEYRINEETKEEPKKTIEEEASELMEEFVKVRKKVMDSTKDNIEERQQMEVILDVIEELLAKETDIISRLQDPECGQWSYNGDDIELQKFTFNVLMNELRMCSLLASFDKLAEELDSPYASSASKLAVRIGCITLRIAMENLHLTMHTAYKQECEKRTKDGQKE